MVSAPSVDGVLPSHRVGNKEEETECWSCLGGDLEKCFARNNLLQLKVEKEHFVFQYFAREYAEYVEGFKVGKEYWLGLKRVHE